MFCVNAQHGCPCRFSAVTCELVHRLPTTRKSRVTSPPPPRPPVSGGADKAPLPSTKPVLKAPVPSTPGTSVPPKNSEATPKAKDDGSDVKKPTKSSVPPKTPHAEPKDSAAPGTGGKRKSPATASVGVSGGANANSLASMWGKAPAKKAAPAKTPAPATKAASPPVAAALAGTYAVLQYCTA